MAEPTLGCKQDELDTPALCIDPDRLDANIAQLVAACQAHAVAWRPHAKCHKSPDLGRRLLAAGAIGLTCAKLGEAEVMADAGIGDLLIANMLVGPGKVQRFVELTRRADPILVVDDLRQALPMDLALRTAGRRARVLVEVDIGMRRVGVPPGPPALELAQRLQQLPALEFCGVMGYEGHLLTIDDPGEKQGRITEALDRLTGTAEAMIQEGVPCPIVSCGGTGSFQYSVSHPGVTEMQAGGAIFMDQFYRQKCHVDAFQNALLLLTTVVSRPAPDRAIIDAGRKSLNMELAMPVVAGRNDVAIENLSAEHGWLRVLDPRSPLAIGDRLQIIPGYVDFTTVLHDRFYVMQQGTVRDIWPLAARGKLQ